MGWYSAELERYPFHDLGPDAKSTMPDQVVCVRTNQPEYVRLVTDIVGSRYCDVQPSSSGKSLILYVAPPPNFPLAEVRKLIHCELRERLLATIQQSKANQTAPDEPPLLPSPESSDTSVANAVLPADLALRLQEERNRAAAEEFRQQAEQLRQVAEDMRQAADELRRAQVEQQEFMVEIRATMERFKPLLNS